MSSQSAFFKYILLICSFLIPAYFHISYVLTHIYNHGSTLLDVGWFTYLMTNYSSYNLFNPEVLQNTHLGETFFYTHFSPFFIFLSFLYEKIFFFLSASSYFALFIGSMNALISLSIFLIGINIFTKLNIYKLILLFFVAIFSAFNGQVLAMMGFPHIEIAIPVLIIFFLTLFYLEKTFLATLVFVFLLTIREDAGFHLFGLIFMINLFLYLQYRDFKTLDKKLIFYAFIAFFYSVIAIFIQKYYFAGSDNALERIYIGNPAFSHISYEVIIQRLKFVFENREYLYLPVIFTFLLTILTRNLLFLASFFASLPWVFLSFFAVNSMHSNFSNYCIFPFIIVLSWSMIVFLILEKKSFVRNINKKYFFIAFILTSLLSTINFPDNKGNEDSKPWKSIIFKDFRNLSASEEFVKNFDLYKKEMEYFVFDEAISALLSKHLKTKNYAYLNNYSTEQKNNLDTLIFYENKNDKKIKKLLQQKQFKFYYKIKNTNITIASNNKLNIKNTNERI